MSEIKELLDTLADDIDKDKIELFKRVIGDFKVKQYNNPKDFFYDLLYPWEKFIGGYLKSTVGMG